MFIIPSTATDSESTDPSFEHLIGIFLKATLAHSLENVIMRQRYKRNNGWKSLVDNLCIYLKSHHLKIFLHLIES